MGRGCNPHVTVEETEAHRGPACHARWGHPSIQPGQWFHQSGDRLLSALPANLAAPLRSAEMMFFCGEAAGSLLILFYFLL